MAGGNGKSSGRRLVPKPGGDRTIQTKIPTIPVGPCAKECGRSALPGRKDKLCANCAHFADVAIEKAGGKP